MIALRATRSLLVCLRCQCSLCHQTRQASDCCRQSLLNPNRACSTLGLRVILSLQGCHLCCKSHHFGGSTHTHSRVARFRRECALWSRQRVLMTRCWRCYRRRHWDTARCSWRGLRAATRNCRVRCLGPPPSWYNTPVHLSLLRNRDHVRSCLVAPVRSASRPIAVMCGHCWHPRTERIVRWNGRRRSRCATARVVPLLQLQLLLPPPPPPPPAVIAPARPRLFHRRLLLALPAPRHWVLDDLQMGTL